MLLSVILELRADRRAELPAYLGRAAYRAFLVYLSAIDANLAQALHDNEDAKPVTCSSLLEAPAGTDTMVVEPGRKYRVRITSLDEKLSQVLANALQQRPPDVWEMQGHRFGIEAITCDPAREPWSGWTTYAALAERRLLAAEATQNVKLEFASPTAFKSGGMQAPLPLPGLVFGSLVERWNAFSPIKLEPEVRQFGEAVVGVSSFRLESQMVKQKNGAPYIGAVGRVTYRALDGDRYWWGALQMLGDFALYSGVGWKTTIGMGQCRKIGGVG